MRKRIEFSGQVGQVVVGTVVQAPAPTPTPTPAAAAAPDCKTCQARAGLGKVGRHKWLALCRRQRWLRIGFILNRFPCTCV